MSFLSNISTVTLIAAATLACNASMAATNGSASASISNIHFEIVDLTPDDGIAPSISFFNEYSAVYTRVNNHMKDDQSADDNYHYQYDLNYNSATSSTNASSAVGYGDAMHGIATKGYQTGGDFYAHFATNTQFFLSRNTGIIITGKISGGTSMSNAGTHELGGFVRYNIQSATLNTGIPGTIIQRAWGESIGQYTTEDFSMTFNNNRNSSVYGIVDMSVGVYGNIAADAPPVPEPESWAMMGTGLLALSAFARQRRRKSQATKA